MIDRDREKAVTDRREGKFQRNALRRLDDQRLFGFDDFAFHDVVIIK